MQLFIAPGLLRTAQILHGFRKGALKARVVERSQAHRVAASVEQLLHGVVHEAGVASVDLEFRRAEHLEPELDVGGATGQDVFEVSHGFDVLDDAVDEALVALGFFVSSEILGDVGGEEAVFDSVLGRGRAAFGSLGARALLRIGSIGPGSRVDFRISVARVGRRLVFDCILILILLQLGSSFCSVLSWSCSVLDSGGG